MKTRLASGDYLRPFSRLQLIPFLSPGCKMSNARIHLPKYLSFNIHPGQIVFMWAIWMRQSRGLCFKVSIGDKSELIWLAVVVPQVAGKMPEATSSQCDRHFLQTPDRPCTNICLLCISSIRMAVTASVTGLIRSR